MSNVSSVFCMTESEVSTTDLASYTPFGLTVTIPVQKGKIDSIGYTSNPAGFNITTKTQQAGHDQQIHTTIRAE